jgi:hypothetical protein
MDEIIAKASLGKTVENRGFLNIRDTGSYDTLSERARRAGHFDY